MAQYNIMQFIIGYIYADDKLHKKQCRRYCRMPSVKTLQYLRHWLL